MWPPEAKKDPSALNTKKFDFEKNFFAFYVTRSYLASGGRKTAKENVFGSTLGPRNMVFHVYRPPGAQNDPSSENTKKPDFEQIFFVFNVKRSFLASGGRKRKKKYFWFPRIRFFTFCGLQRPKMTPLHKTQKNDFEKIFCIQSSTFYFRGAHYP